MGTRAMITFTDGNKTGGTADNFNVCKHWDGYPRGILPLLKAAQDYAWPLPRFEADDFAAAFVCATKALVKDRGGDTRLLPSGSPHKVAPGDIEYRYVVREAMGDLIVDVYTTNFFDYNNKSEELVFSGKLEVALETYPA